MALTQVQPGMLASDSQYTGFKNRILNGQMAIDQRNAGASVTVSDSTKQYTVDRWSAFETTDGVVTAQQVSDAPTGFINSLKITTTTADSSLSANQRLQFSQDIEGLNVSDLGWGTANAKTITLSFWVKSSLIGTFGGSLANSAADRSYVFTYSIPTASTWTQISVTIAGDTSGTWLTTNGIGIRVYFGLGVGTDFQGSAGSWAGALYLAPSGAVSVIGTLNATWQLSGVQLEKGSTATSFDYRPYGTELSLCQRYFEKSYDQSVVAGASSQFGSISAICCGNINRAFSTVTFKVPKRATPTLTLYSTTGASGNFRNLSQSADMPISISGAGQCGESGAALLASSGIVSETDTLIGQFTASAEL